ncbi:hypothetical protein Tco_1435642, partial [Tanacetum coccineum]
LFKVSCGEEKLEDNETPLLDQTLVVVNPPFDEVISLVDTSVSKEAEHTVLPPQSSSFVKDLMPVLSVISNVPLVAAVSLFPPDDIK